MDAEAHADDRVPSREALPVAASLEVDRAGSGIDREHDQAARAPVHRLRCPALVLWWLRADQDGLYRDVLALRRPCAAQRRGRGRHGSRHMAEEAPEELATELLTFLGKA
jgi:haloacetate dehalogenase